MSKNEEKNLSSLIGFKSQIKYNSKGQGYIKIFYENLEQYEFIVKKIKIDCKFITKIKE